MTIDHILIGDLPWPEISQVNIHVTEEEIKILKDSTNWKTSIKGCWDYDSNSGDHRNVLVELCVCLCPEDFTNKRQKNRR